MQEAVLEALGQLGFGITAADLELGGIRGSGQQLPFYQEIELAPPPHYAHQVNEIEVTFLADPAGMEVVLEADKRGGLFSGGHDALSRHRVSHTDTARSGWNAVVGSWISQLVETHNAGFSDQPYGHSDIHGSYAHKDEHSHHAHHDHDGAHGGGHRSGPGMGTVVAAGAAGLAVGVVGGMVAAEAVDEIADFFEGDEGEEA